MPKLNDAQRISLAVELRKLTNICEVIVDQLARSVCGVNLISAQSIRNCAVWGREPAERR